MHKPVYIYALVCPKTSEVRYVGKSVDPDHRFSVHLSHARHGKHQVVSRWIKGLLNSGLRPLLKVIFEVPQTEDWRVHECRLIAEHLSAGCRLTNGTIGGEGVTFATEEMAKAAVAARMAGRTEDSFRRQSEKMKAIWADPAHKERVVATRKATMKARGPDKRPWFKRSAEGEARRAAAVQAFWANPENREKQRLKMKERTSDPAYIEKMKQGKSLKQKTPPNRADPRSLA